jgi:mono/diheme cytochrome c family protein
MNLFTSTLPKTLTVTLLVGIRASLALGQTAPAAPGDFVHQVAPVLKEHCGGCHMGDKRKGGFSMNTQASFLAGGENGKVLDAANPAKSRLLEVLLSADPDVQMPPPEKGKARPTAAQLEPLRQWVLAGGKWEPGFAFQKPSYQAPVKPRPPQLPAAAGGENHPLDRLLSVYYAKHGLSAPRPAPDSTFVRRVYLDLVGLLPDPPEVAEFEKDTAPDKRERLVDRLLSRKMDYAEHWLTFWNDLLRNDYGGTGFITGGRKQVSAWLYEALVSNKAYDVMVRELVNPSEDTEGYAQGITWRGTVSASQTREVQFAQSVSQSFLGLNLKCASCHDSFIDKWKLSDAYGLAAIYSEKPIEMARCEKLTGKTAVPAWPFPELGQVDPAAPRNQRLKQLAELMTHPDNGWFARTMVNRLWAAMLGRGLVHPVDAMGTEPWNEELLDYLGWEFARQRFDLKASLRLIATSHAYQAEAAPRVKDDESAPFVFRGPRAKRMSAEQFLDAVWTVGGNAPRTWDAPVRRGEPSAELISKTSLTGRRILIPAQAEPAAPNAKPAARVAALGALRKVVELPSKPVRVSGILEEQGAGETRLLVNGALQPVQRAIRRGRVTDLQVNENFEAGKNVLVLVQKIAGGKAAGGAVFAELQFTFRDGNTLRVATDETWEASVGFGEEMVKAGKLSLKHPEFNNAAWSGVGPAEGGPVADENLLAQFVWAVQPRPAVRAALVKADLLQRTLGRPNRDQIVTSRPQELSTLEALDLSAGQRLSDLLSAGAAKLVKQEWPGAPVLVSDLFVRCLSRQPNDLEMESALGLVQGGGKPSQQAVEDLLWTLCVLPEFQLIR